MPHVREGELQHLILNGESSQLSSPSPLPSVVAREGTAVAAAASGENKPGHFPLELSKPGSGLKQQAQLDYRSIDPSSAREPQSQHKARLAMSSRERLDMDTGGSGSLFKRKHGCFVPRWLGALIAAFFVVSLLLVGLLVGFLAPRTVEEVSSATASATTETPAELKTGTLRLPSSVHPENYNVRLQPFLYPGNFTFNFQLSVIVVCVHHTNNITLNANNITVDETSVILTVLSTNGTVVAKESAPKVARLSYDTKNQFLVVELESSLVQGYRYNLTMRGIGVVNDLLTGFYRSEYTDNGNVSKWLAVTQFEPTDARRAFPCFDEPSMKATFDVTIVRWKNMSSISNGPSKLNQTLDDDWVAETFETTPKMSTYLLAFMISDFAYMESSDKENKKFRVWARNDVLSTAAYALEIGPKIINYYNKYFDIPYPLNKTDLAAIPDFNAGAMENWGLITFRETAMLYDPTMSSATDKQIVATVLAHELGHQWFGNLVTPAWWDDLWLNEGFATYMEFVGSAAVEPTWKMPQQFVIDSLQPTMQLDSLKTSHAIYVKVNSPEEINEIFDSISYGKGGSIIRMMDKFLGNVSFSLGLKNYLNATKYGNAVSNDLWHHLEQAHNTTFEKSKEYLNVTEIMNKWARQVGYPVVNVTRNYTDNSVTVSQRRFLLDSQNETETDKTVLWDIPLTWAENSNIDPDDWSTETKHWLNKQTETFPNVTSSSKTWVIFNVEEVGFYRVNYDMDNWQMILSQLRENHTKINMVNRAQVIDDSFNLARAGQLQYDVALNTTLYLVNELDYIPWSSALDNLGFLNYMLCRSDIYGDFKDYVGYLIRPWYEKYKWTNTSEDSVLIQYAQLNAISWACKYAQSDCVSTALNLFQQWKANPNNRTIIHQNFRGTVYCIGIKNGNYSDWQIVWNQYVKEIIPSEKKRLMRALSCSSELWVLSRYLGYALNSSSGIRSQDGLTVLSQVAHTDYGRELAFNFIRDKWDTIFKVYGLNTFSLSDTVSTISGLLNTPFEVEELKTFWKSVDSSGTGGTAKRAFHQGIENAQANVKFMQNYYNIITNWLGTVLKNAKNNS